MYARHILLLEEEKFDISVGQISSNQAAAKEKYFEERHPQGGIIWQSFQPEDISLENIPCWTPRDRLSSQQMCTAPLEISYSKLCKFLTL